MNACKYATDTGRSWCGCPVSCTEIECRNPKRLAAILPGKEGRADGANWHSKYPEEYADRREEAPFILVRSKYCCRAHCFDFESFDLKTI